MGEKANEYATTGAGGTFLINAREGRDRATKASLDNKRLVTLDDVGRSEVIDGPEVKRYTGFNTFNARKFGKKDNVCYCRFLLLFTMNHMAKIEGVDKQIKERMLIFEFLSLFVGKDKDVNEAKHIYKKNKTNMDEVWQKSKATAWFHTLLKYYKIYQAEGEVWNEAKMNCDTFEELAQSTDPFMDW